MEKKFLLMAAAAAMFAACSNDADPVKDAAEFAKAPVVNQQVPVGFNTYVNRATTRAGWVGEITDAAALQVAAVNGFGVFAYYTNNDSYDQVYTPNFMYNQQVTYNTDHWTYDPIKYWPNEFGDNAIADEIDKISFFAYAPYAAATAATGKVTGDASYGIAGFSRNTATGDPLVKYVSSFDATKQVDLAWGVVPAGSTTWAVDASPATIAVDPGKPWLNIQHPAALDQNLTFEFNHALSALNVQIDLYADKTSAQDVAVNTSGYKTKVFVRSVTFKGFATKGSLNLNNQTANIANWLTFDGTNTIETGQEFTIQDGRKNGNEGATAASNEAAFLNSVLVQKGEFGSTAAGVTATPVNLFANPAAATDPIYVIPNGEELAVTIEYDVLTEDPNLANYLNDGKTHGSVVKNVITKQIKDGSDDAITLANGKKYTISLHLGLEEVTFDAAVAGWGAGEPGSADLPHNN